MTFRFAAPELLALGRPPALAASPFETLLDASRARLVVGLNAAGIAYDAGNLETDAAIIITEEAVERDVLRRQAIDDAIAQTFLGSATSSMLDQRAADYGVLRRVLQVADPFTGLPEITEDDDSLRLRARLAWEAQSVAGPTGAYVFHALDAHPEVFDALAIGPETDLVSPGEVLVVVQSRSETGVPTNGIVDAVAARLDAYETVYADGTSQIRPVRDEQSVRPLGARVTVAAPRARVYPVTATLYVSPGVDGAAVRAQALLNLATYQASRKRVGFRVPRSGLEAALALVSAAGIPAVTDVDVVEPDVVCSHMEIPVPGAVSVSVVVR